LEDNSKFKISPKIMLLSDLFGFCGAFFLIVRLLPLLREQFVKTVKIEFNFLILELTACLFLGTSAVLIKSLPFIIANCICFVNLSIIISLQIRLRMSSEFYVDEQDINDPKKNPYPEIIILEDC